MAEARFEKERYDMRKTPIYQLSEDLGTWMDQHRELIFDEVLESTEAAVEGEYPLSKVPVIILQSDGGTTLFALKSLEATKESIQKALTWFVDSEQYEKAARARDVKAAIDELGNPPSDI
jgi:hypothetical protein